MTVLSYGYWTTRLGANPAVLNDTIIVNGQALTIVGVAPRGFSGTTLGTRAERVRADHDARVDVARAGRDSTTAGSTGRTCSRG